MATKLILKDAKAPLLSLAAALPKAAAPNPQLIQKPLLHLSGLRHYLYQQPSTKVDGLGLGGALDSTFGSQSRVQCRVQARRSDDEEDDHMEELEDEDDYHDDFEDFPEEEDEEDKSISEFQFDHDEKNCKRKPTIK